MITDMANLFFPIGGGNEIGASSYFIQLGETRFLLDAGIRLGANESVPRFPALFEQELLDGLWDLDAILISHAHLDHVGALPTVMGEAPEVPIYGTHPTKDIMETQLRPRRADETFVDVEAVNEFNEGRVQRVIENVVPTLWNEPIQIADCRVTFFPAGHILGASMVYIESDSGNVLFSGDFTPFDQMTVPGYKLPANLEVDLLIAESTYGYQHSRHVSDVATEREIFAQKIEQCLEKGGTVLIPAFAIGRSQEVALILQSLMDGGRLETLDVYIDGLAQYFCELYEDHNVKVFSPNVRKASRGLVRERNLEDLNGVIIASSGMLLDKSASAKYAERLLPDPRNTLFFSGYLDEESPGRRLNSLSKNKTFRLNGKNVSVNATVDAYRLSAHVDNEGILDLVESVYPETVIFVHGVPQYKRKNSVLRETSQRFQGQINVHHATNGVLIYF